MFRRPFVAIAVALAAGTAAAVFAPLSDRIRGEIAKISDKPIRFVLNTHWHGDHVGGNECFAKMGATVIAQDRVRERMSEAHTNPVFGSKSEPSPAAALPVVSFSDSLSFHMNGEDMVCFHAPNANTDGDVIVWFPAENVVHMGDCLFNGMYPVVDVGTGGTLAGMIAAQERIQKLKGLRHHRPDPENDGAGSDAKVRRPSAASSAARSATAASTGSGRNAVGKPGQRSGSAYLTSRSASVP